MNMNIRRYIVLLFFAWMTVGVQAQEELHPVGKIPRSGRQEIRRVRPMMSDSAKVRPALVTRLNRLQPTSKVELKRVASEHYTFATILDGDTVPLVYLREVNVYSSGMLLTAKEIKKNAKMIRNVRMMMPYAKEAKRRLDALEVEIANLPKKQRKAAIKKAEQQLKADYKDQLSKYTFSQGLVLIKLIDRETSRTAYSLVGELRGSFRAGLYQALARLFGYNLKTKYDPQHDKKDELMERIVVSIERGQL